MFHSRPLNNHINCIHERYLPNIYPVYNSYFAELPRKGSSLTILQRNLKLLVIEMFKTKLGCDCDIMKRILEIDHRN